MEFKDHYEILGVSHDATTAQIKQAFRRLARKYHPDVSQEKDAAQRMSEINEANAVLSDPVRRAAYDEIAWHRHAGARWDGGVDENPGANFHAPPGWDAGAGFPGARPRESERDAQEFSDFFDALFGRSDNRSRRSAASGHDRGEDLHASVSLDLADAWHGSTRQISLRVPDDTGDSTLKILDVKIPKGIRAGQQIRLAGQGGKGRHGAPDGDLLLEVSFTPHERFTVDGRTLRAVLQVAPWEAALGAVVPVTMPDGSRLSVRIPHGTQSGNTLTVHGKGLPGQPPGDLDLEVQVVLPPADTAEARSLYETMAKTLAFDPRSVDSHAGQSAKRTTQSR
ncbi:DnaJ domain-containing protein [Pigmentiphaga aceris]|uniref:DnaJ domain-containing protein n=1 Tax=Pigmentiphaga aceris TaxID=1940612 RepID=A0A5C0B2N2_9BURK|nr:DnaJ C-terminal domain-containing protein [Pigmentiphaga aceris]QEI07001.1 DnaJ domain-containing protein [Pigmentiphaga aceris]